MSYVVTLTIEYDAHTEMEARLRATRDALDLLKHDDVLGVTADEGEPPDNVYPITKAYLADSVVERVQEYTE